jgi:hypothetical protein
MGFRRLLLLVLCSAPLLMLFRLNGQFSNPYIWRPVHIVAGGFIPGFVAHPTQPGLIYARTDIGSVYRWHASDGQWIPLTDFQTPANYNLNGPESVALDPTDPNRLYIAAGMYSCGGCPAAMLISTDQGATFTTVNTPFLMGSNNDGRNAGERLVVNPFSPNELFMGTRYNGLYKSEDNAQTWNRVTSFPLLVTSDGFGIQWVLFDPVNSGTIYAGAYTSSMVYKSTDDGATWAALPGQPLTWPFSVTSTTHAPAPMRAVLNPDGNLYVTYGDYPGPNNMNYGVVEKFNPSTNTWTNITPPLDQADGESSQRGGFCGVTQDPNSSGTVAVSTLDRWYPVDTVYLTNDGGATWIDLAHTTSAAGFSGLSDGGNYYFNPSVFQPFSPWLTFGDTSEPTGSARFGWWMSALLIDPTNPNHLMFGTGATVYATENLSAVSSGTAPTWFVQAHGIEETAVNALISPTTGANLLSGVDDIGGFRHDRFNVSPVAGMYTNPVATTVGSLDWAGRNPSVIVRTQSPNTASTSPCTYGGLSSDGGTSWTPIPACPAGVNSGTGGVLAVDASGGMLMWSPATGSSPQYSTDGGNTWAAVTGLSTNAAVVADKVVPNVFYAFSGGQFYSTGTSGGTAFSKVNSTALASSGACNGSGCGIPVANFSKKGDIWLPLGSNGLLHSADGGVTWTNLSAAAWANSVAVGAASTSTGNPAIYLYGTAPPSSVMAIYRSDDDGTTWVQINDDSHQYGGPTIIQADPRVYGRVYLGMNGRGIIYGEPAAGYLRSLRK